MPYVVLGAQEISASSANNVGELLRETSSVDVTGYGSLGSAQSASIRGSSASQVLVMVDGRPINSITFGSADLSQIPLDYVERIEIVKGPTSHLYGANAMGGVINVITKKPPFRPSFKAGVSYGSFNTQNDPGRSWADSGPFRLFIECRSINLRMGIGITPNMMPRIFPPA